MSVQCGPYHVQILRMPVGLRLTWSRLIYIEGPLREASLLIRQSVLVRSSGRSPWASWAWK